VETSRVQEDELRLQVERYRRDVRAEADRGKSTMERMEEMEASLEKTQVRCLVWGLGFRRMEEMEASLEKTQVRCLV
jgi:hypothetical protein